MTDEKATKLIDAIDDLQFAINSLADNVYDLQKTLNSFEVPDKFSSKLNDIEKQLEKLTTSISR